MSSTVLYVGNFGDMRSAAFTRAYNLSKLLASEDTMVVICSCNTGSIVTVTSQSSCKTKYPFKMPSGSFLSLLELITNNRALSFISNCVKDYHPDRLIVYNGLYNLTNKLQKMAVKKGIRVYTDSTEWYESAPIYHIASYFFAYSVDKRIRKLDIKMSGAIAISKYFYDYYTNIGVQTIRIPPLVDAEVFEENKDCVKSTHDGIKLLYAGSPGTKDLLTPIFEALKILNSHEEVVTFDIFGVSKDQAERNWGQLSLTKGVCFHGRVNHAIILEEVRKAHFTVLLRRKEKYAMAGYSTKAAESMYFGTPIICNDVGGTDIDIINGKTGFVLPTASFEPLVELLRNILKMPDNEYLNMRKNTKEYATSTYSGGKYKNDLLRFLDYE